MPTSNRSVRPVTLDPSEDTEKFLPSTIPQPRVARFLICGPILAFLGFIGWIKIVSGAPLSVVRDFSLADFAVDLTLLLLFIIPHSMLARGFGKRILNKPFGPCGERPLYIFISGITLCLLFCCWKTTGPVLWDLDGIKQLIGRLIQIGGLTLIVWATLVLGATHMFGIPHLKELKRGGKEPTTELIALAPYSFLRQPINLGFILLLIGMTEVTPDRLLLGTLTIAWILLVTPTEERDASLQFGDGYERYRNQTPRWIPKKPHNEE